MRIQILTTGKTKENFYQNAIQHYLQTMPPPISCSYEELKDCKSNLEKEGKQLLEILEKRKLFPGGRNQIVLLDEKGKKYSSLELSAWIENQKNNSVQNIIFILGGAYGFSPQLRDTLSNATLLSLSPLTFPHELARVILCEQIYRSLHILGGSKYHHE